MIVFQAPLYITRAHPFYYILYGQKGLLRHSAIDLVFLAVFLHLGINKTPIFVA